jgi:hypothetical protein
VEAVSDGVAISASGDQIGVQAISEAVAILGGPPVGKLFDERIGSVGAGIVGNAVGDVGAGDVPFAYGGWFDALNGTAPLHLEPSKLANPPQSARRGDFFVDNAGGLWFCTTDGDPATWKQVQLV